MSELATHGFKRATSFDIFPVSYGVNIRDSLQIVALSCSDYLAIVVIGYGIQIIL